MNAIDAAATVRALDQQERALLDVLVERINLELPRVLALVKPGAEFTMHIGEAVDYGGQKHTPSRIVLNATAQSFRNQGWEVKDPIPGYGTGVLQFDFVRPLREQALVPSIKPIGIE